MLVFAAKFDETASFFFFLSLRVCSNMIQEQPRRSTAPSSYTLNIDDSLFSSQDVLSICRVSYSITDTYVRSKEP